MDCHACEFVSGHAAPLARAETTRELDKPSSLGRESSSGSHLAPILEECIIVNSLTEHSSEQANVLPTNKRDITVGQNAGASGRPSA